MELALALLAVAILVASVAFMVWKPQKEHPLAREYVPPVEHVHVFNTRINDGDSRYRCGECWEHGHLAAREVNGG